jgi:hypothetical protein
MLIDYDKFKEKSTVQILCVKSSAVCSLLHANMLVHKPHMNG